MVYILVLRIREEKRKRSIRHLGFDLRLTSLGESPKMPVATASPAKEEELPPGKTGSQIFIEYLPENSYNSLPQKPIGSSHVVSLEMLEVTARYREK